MAGKIGSLTCLVLSFSGGYWKPRSQIGSVGLRQQKIRPKETSWGSIGHNVWRARWHVFIQLERIQLSFEFRMTTALCAAAEDPGNVLIQRNLLDFLCTSIPLNSDHVIQADLIQILRRCLFVLLRRDISLNRRLYQWLLNRWVSFWSQIFDINSFRSNDGSSNTLGGADEITDLEFFNTYSIPLIRQAIASFIGILNIVRSFRIVFRAGNRRDLN